MRLHRPPIVAAAIFALATGASLGFLAPPATLAFLVDSATSVAIFGTSTNTSCANAGKDRHRFATFGFGLPGAVTSINGLSVNVKVALDATGGTNRICAQLSWNAGASWTATQQANVTSATQTWYTLGGSAFLWGRAWAVGDLSDANFRVRLIDVSSGTTRDFFLDSVQVQVLYTP